MLFCCYASTLRGEILTAPSYSLRARRGNLQPISVQLGLASHPGPGRSGRGRENAILRAVVCGVVEQFLHPKFHLYTAKIFPNSQYPRTMAELQATSVSQDAISVAQLELGGNPNAMALRRPFDPVAHDLDATFRLTRFADLKG